MAPRVEAAVIETPLGAVHYACRDGRLVALCFPEHWDLTRAAIARHAGDLQWVEDAKPGRVGAVLRAYFAGDLEGIDDLAVELYGTAFQRTVWSALRTIPVGTTISYAELARRVGRPRAVRAVGAANGANPISIVLPCHRVIGTSGALTGYGGGLERKQWLLRHERATLV